MSERQPLTGRAFVSLAAALAAILATLSPAYANTYVAGSPVDASAGADPFAACTADNVAHQEAVLGSTLYPGAELEPRLTIDPTNPKNLAGEFQQDRWSDGSSRSLVATVSHDGGKSWSRVVVPGITQCSGGTYPRASDPWVSFAADGTLYAISDSVDFELSRTGILVSRSTTKGDSWSAPVALIADTYLGAFNDKESVTADPYSASRVYAAWDRFISPPSGRAADQGVFRSRVYAQETWFSRTTNGGVNWEPARAIYTPGIDAATVGNVINVLPSGELVNGFISSTVKPKPQTFTTKSAYVALIRSADKGASWSKIATVVASLDVNFAGPYDPDNGNPIRGGGLPDFTVDPNTGNLYAVWEDDAQVSGIDAIQFSQSSDGGLSWSAPVKINQTPTSIELPDQQAFTPTVKVASDGTVGVTYYDLRQNTAAAGLTADYWFVHCHGTCTTPSNWVESHVAGPFDEEQAAFAGGYFLGDYAGLVTNGTVFEALFGQAVSQAARNPSDVYFATLSARR